MGFDASGIYTRVRDWTNDAAAAIKIRADYHDDHDLDIANALSKMICKDGRSIVETDIPWGGKKITNLGPPSAATDAVTKGYVDTLRTFNTPITMSGAGANGRINFSGPTGVLGLSFTDPAVDMGFGLNTANNNFVWNSKADFTGDNLMALSPAGSNTTLTLTTKLTGAGIGPYITLLRDLNIGVNGAVGGIVLQGKNSAGVVKNFGHFYSQVLDPTSGTEDSRYVFQGFTAGVSGNFLLLDGDRNMLTGDLTFVDTGSSGLKWNALDIGFGLNASGSFLWNSKADLSGDNAMLLNGVNASPINAQLILLSKITTASTSPSIVFSRDVIPAAGTNLGGIVSQAKNSIGTVKTYGQIFNRADDVGNGTEDSSWYFQGFVAGVNNNLLVLDGLNNSMLGNLTVNGNQTVNGTLVTDGLASIKQQLSIPGNTGSTLILAKTASGSANVIQGRTGSELRWQLQLGDAVAEAGSGAATTGSGLQLHAYDNAGVIIGAAMSIIRGSRAVTFYGDLNISGGGGFTGGASTLTQLTCGSISSPNVNLIMGPTGAGTVYLRPSGVGVVAGQFTVDDTYATVHAASILRAGKGLQCSTGNGAYTAANSVAFHFISGTGTKLYVNALDNGVIQTVSDYRFKTDVVPLPSMWAKVKAMRPCSYTPITEEDPASEPMVADTRTRWGFIAHELQEDLIDTAANAYKDAPDAIQSPNLLAVCAAMCAALQEAMTRIEALEAA